MHLGIFRKDPISFSAKVRSIAHCRRSISILVKLWITMTALLPSLRYSLFIQQSLPSLQRSYSFFISSNLFFPVKSKKNINPFLDVKIVHIYTSVNEKAGKRTKEQMVEGMKAIKNYRSLLSILNELVQRLPQTLILRGKKKKDLRRKILVCLDNQQIITQKHVILDHDGDKIVSLQVITIMEFGSPTSKHTSTYEIMALVKSPEIKVK